MVDDGWPRHEKVVAAGKSGRALWMAAGPICAGERTDGVVSALTVKLAAVLAECSPRSGARALVASGLWHDHRTIQDCGRCFHGDPVHQWAGTSLTDDEYFFHDWCHWQLARRGKSDPIEQQRDLRRKDLSRNRRLCSAIRARDRDICRYCGVQTTWIPGDRKSPTSGTYDHIDPFDFGDGTPASDKGNSASKIVVACRKCNGEKKDRTPEQAGMTLLPVPTPESTRSAPIPAPTQAVDNSPVSDRISDRISGRFLTGPETGQKFPRVTREAGQGQNRARNGPETGQNGSDRFLTGPEPGQNGSGPDQGGAGPVQAGPGRAGQQAAAGGLLLPGHDEFTIKERP